MDAQQTQPAQPSDSFYNFMAWLEVNKQKVMIWCAAAVVVVIVAIVIISYQGQKERRASQALSNVRAPSTATGVPAAGAAEGYLKVAQEHAGTQAGARALLLAAAAKFQDGAYADAQKYYDQFTRDYPESRWLPQAYFGLASSLDAQGKTADATKQFEDLRRRFPNDAVTDETKLALARMYEAQNRPADAYRLYDELVKANQFSGLGSEAGMRQAELVEKFPELAKTNQPAPVTIPPMMSMTNIMPQATNRAAPTNRMQIIPMTNTTQRSATNTSAGQTQVVTLPLTLPTTNSAATAKP